MPKNQQRAFWRLANLIVALFAGSFAVSGQVTGSITSFGVTNYTSYIIAGDTNSGGRQAIRTSTAIFYTNSSGTAQTYDFQLAYQLLDSSNHPVAILDETGASNLTYSVYQTNTLPEFIFIPPNHFISISSYYLTNTAPLQPVGRLDPNQYYTASLKVYSRADGPGAYTYTGQSSLDGAYTFYDFTNTVSPDPSPNLLVTLDFPPFFDRNWSISNSPAQQGFPVTADFLIQRYDDFTNPPRPTNTTVSLNFQLINVSNGLSVPLVSTSAVFNVTIQSHDTNNPPNPVVLFESTNFTLLPAVALDSVDAQYKVITTITHTEGPAVVVDNSETTPPQQLLDFNGNLFFGPILTVFTNIDFAPTVTNSVAGDHLDVLLPISSGAGSVPGAPGHTYGTGSVIAVKLLTNDTAVIENGVTVTLNGPTPDISSIANVFFGRGPITLSSNGAATTAISVGYPAGFSTSFPTNSIRWAVGAFPLANVVLNQNLNPASNVLTYPFAVYGIQENLPVWFEVPAIQWVVNSGQFIMNPTGAIFTRQTEDDLLTANTALLTDKKDARRVSNDAYFRNAVATTGSLVVAADSNGVARISCQLNLAPPELRPHFPYSGNANGAEISTVAGGALIISNGVVAPGSFLPVSAPVPVAYARDCADTNCSAALAGPATLPFTANGNQLTFTGDGGLVAYGSVPPTNLTWGYLGGSQFAQQAYTVKGGGYLMAGTFLTGGQTTVTGGAEAGVLLFSGFGDGTNTTYLERPNDNNYPNGFANYAGLNFRAPANGDSVLAGIDTGPYPLTSRSKYYARYVGVSGIHESASFPSTLPLYGYNFTFTTYRLSFLDSDVYQSRTDGSIAFPTQPAGFLQEFSDMIFSCRGGLESASVPSSSGVKHLNYWDVYFTPESIEFHPGTNDPCGTGQRWLVLGSKTTLPFITQELDAALGFQPNGNLVTAADGVAGCDSRFAVPAQLTLQGSGGGVYPLSTCSDGYFNNWATPGRPANGFYNLAGRLRVPFFEDVRVHLHIMPTGSNTAQISIMGGWPDPNISTTDLGWSVSGSNYFNEAVFDPSADGFPEKQSVTIANYENSSSTTYHPRAQRNWIQVAVFDYPLQWNPALRQFAGFQDAPVQLPIIDVNSRLKEISPGKVDFDFDQDVTLQLPVIKSLDLLNDVVGQDGPLSSVSNAVRSAIGAVLQVSGFNELQQTLREDATSFFQPVFATAFTPAANQLYNQLSSFPQTDQAAFLSNAVYQVNNANLSSLLNNINGAAGQANTVVGDVNKTISDAQNDLGVLLKILAKDGSGQRHTISAIIGQLVSDQGPALGFVTSLAGGALDDLVTNLDPTLDDIQSQLEDLSNQVSQVQSSLTSVSGDFNQALGQSLNDASGASQFVQLAANNLSNRLAGVLTPAGDYFSANPAAAQQAILQELQNAFLGSPLPADYQQTLKQFLFDKNAALDLLMDTLFDQINGAIRDGLTDLITDNLDNTLQDVKGLASGSFLSAKIRGEPTFNGDSLRKIHLDAKVQVNVPESMNFDAYMEILELNSQTTPIDCIPPGPPAAEVTIGANNVKLDWPGLNPTGTPLTLSIAAKWTLQSGNVIGVGGMFDIKGEVGFEGCSVNEIGAMLAFGEEENYFAAKVAGTINILGVPVDCQAGVFVGKACSLQPILFIDPEATNVLSLPPNEFAGIYVEFGASLSLSQILFGESDCFLDIGVSESSAVYYDGGPGTQQIGMRQTIGADASLLCILSASASLTMFSTITHSPSGFALELGGEAQICGSIGPCPFCISGCMGVTVTGEVDSGGINYHVDY